MGEIDKPKPGKRKFNKGHAVDGVWCIGGIKESKAKQCFYLAVEDRTAITIYEIIKIYALPVSILYTDTWRALVKAHKDHNYEHKTVNHSWYLKILHGTHINTIEGLKNGLKY